MEKKSQEGAPEGAEGSKRCRRYSAEEKLRLVAECEAPGSSVSLVARKYGISSSLRFRWRQLKESGGVSGLQAGEAVVPESEVQVFSYRFTSRMAVELRLILTQGMEFWRAVRAELVGLGCRALRVEPPWQRDSLRDEAEGRRVRPNCSGV